MAPLPLFLQGPTTFHLTPDRKAEALALLQAYFNEQVLPDLDEEDEESRKPLASLEEALFTFGWEATVDASGTIVFLSFTDRFLSKQDEVLVALAPCVTAGSSLLVAIERQGQYDFAVEGWFFDGTHLHREPAVISFPRSLIDALLRG